MERNEHTITIRAPGERVFELLAQPDAMRRWVGGLVAFEPIDPGPAPGARARQTVEVAGRRWEVESEITRYEPPNALESTLRHRAFTSRVAYRLEEDDGRTRVHAAIESRYAVGRLLGGLVRRQTQRKLEDDLERLRRLAESGA